MKVHLQQKKDYWDKNVKLSDRIRPNSEAAPWVIDEVKKLEEKLSKAEAMLKEPTKLLLIPELMKQAGWMKIPKPLTEDEMELVYRGLYGAGTEHENLVEMGQAVERAHGIGVDK